ncbi:MAG: hypothetical protein SF053_18815 [Bacteroidia bacterium]|nr:hypothetical protein [Bacteroidia bacterium]
MNELMPDTIPRSIAIRTYFSHHAENAGYKQILRFTRPVWVLGYDERDPASLGYWQRRYHFLVEWEAQAVARRAPDGHPLVIFQPEFILQSRHKIA